MNNDFMHLAIKEAKKSNVDIPIGCVIEKDGKILATSHNLREQKNDVTLHAEIAAIREAEIKLNNWRLIGCNLYVTLEPCPMCAWAILNTGINSVYFGAYDEKYGAFGSKINLVEISDKKPNVFGGILEEECKNLLKEYFKKIRQ